MLYLDTGPLIALRLVIAVGAAAAGSFVAVLAKKISHLGLCVLISFAAGALLAVTFLHLIPETFEMVGPLKGALSILSGYLLFFLLTRFVFHVCPACSATHTEVKFHAITIAMIAALSVHSFMDGMAIYSSALSGASTGALILAAVAFHKFPEGMALSLVALSSGMSRTKAFLIGFTVEALTTLTGGAAGLILKFSEHTSWVGFVLGHVGGGFIFIVIHALLSEVVKHHPRYTLFAALVGAASIVAAQFFLRSAHV